MHRSADRLLHGRADLFGGPHHDDQEIGEGEALFQRGVRLTRGDRRHLRGEARVVILGETEHLDVDRLVEALRRSVDLERLRTDQVLPNELGLLWRHPTFHPRLQQFELEGGARGRVARGGERPHREGLTLAIDREPGARAVGPSSFRADRPHEARGERAAEDRVCHAESDVIVVVR